MVKVGAQKFLPKKGIFSPIGGLKRKKTPFFLRFLVLCGVPGGAEMAEISAKNFFHRLRPQTHIFAKFHFSIIFGKKVRAKAKKNTLLRVRRFFCISLKKKEKNMSKKSILLAMIWLKC